MLKDTEAQDVLDGIKECLDLQSNGYHAGEVLEKIVEYLKDCDDVL